MTDALALINRFARRSATTGDETFRDLGLDGIDRMCIADEIEMTFECDLPDTEVERWTSVDDVAQTLRRVQGVPAA